MLTIHEKGIIREYARQIRKQANNVSYVDERIGTSGKDLLDSLEKLKNLVNKFDAYLMGVMFQKIE